MTKEANAPTVSVIVRAATPGRDLTTALLSLCDQTFADWEVIVVHDAETGVDALRRAHGRAARIRQRLANSTNSGAARNLGIAAARGRYIAFLEGDDLWTVDFLERQVQYLESHAWCDLVYCDANLSGDVP